jgi:hypothetical protein
MCKSIDNNQIIRQCFLSIFESNIYIVSKMSLNETYSKVRIGKYLFDGFPIQNGLKQGDALSPLLFNFVLEYAVRKVQETRWD